MVIDTNVLMHADDPRESRQADAIELLSRLLDCETVLAIDEGFDLDPALNRSLIGGEYFENLTPSSFASEALAHLAQSMRTKSVSRSLDAGTRKKINRLVRKPRDRTFLLVAHKSDEQILCSHDYEDFQKSKRPDIKSKLGVVVAEAGEVVPRLAGQGEGAQ